MTFIIDLLDPFRQADTADLIGTLDVITGTVGLDTSDLCGAIQIGWRS